MKKVQHNNWLREQLREPGFAAEYLTAAAADEELGGGTKEDSLTGAFPHPASRTDDRKETG